MFERFTDRARRIVVLSQQEARALRHPVINSAHLLLGILAEHEGVGALALERCGVTGEAVRGKLLEIDGPGTQALSSGHIPFATSTKNVLAHALEESLARGVPYVGPESLLLGLMREDCAGSGILRGMVPGGLDQVRDTVMGLIEQRAGTPEEARDAESTARAAASGGAQGSATRLRGLLSSPRAGGPADDDLRRLFRPPRRPHDPVVPRPELTGPLVAVLGRRERNNVLLIGPSGSGKSALVRWLRQAIGDDSGRLGALEGGRIIELSLSALRIGPGRLLEHQEWPVVLVEDLDVLLGVFAADGATRLTAVLLELAESDAPLILTGTADARRRLAQVAPVLADRFELIEVPAADAGLSAEILRVLRPELHKHHGVTIEDATLAAALRLAEERAAAGYQRVLPGAAVDLLDAAAARAASGPQVPPAPVVRPEHLRADPDAA